MEKFFHLDSSIFCARCAGVELSLENLQRIRARRARVMLRCLLLNYVGFLNDLRRSRTGTSVQVFSASQTAFFPLVTGLVLLGESFAFFFRDRTPGIVMVIWSIVAEPFALSSIREHRTSTMFDRISSTTEGPIFALPADRSEASIVEGRSCSNWKRGGRRCVPQSALPCLSDCTFLFGRPPAHVGIGRR